MHDAAEELRTATTQPDIANVARSKHRDPRFAELDAQIQTAKADREQRPAARKRKRQRAGPALPREVRKEITRCARRLQPHRKLFIADAKLKDRVSRFLRSLLPPKRKRGRPGLDSVVGSSRDGVAAQALTWP
jgi:hypothetical protein